MTINKWKIDDVNQPLLANITINWYDIKLYLKPKIKENPNCFSLLPNFVIIDEKIKGVRKEDDSRPKV